MSVDPDPKKQRCQGILDATGAAGADMGGKVKFCIYSIIVTKICLGDRHDKPINRTNAAKICSWRNSYN